MDKWPISTTPTHYMHPILSGVKVTVRRHRPAASLLVTGALTRILHLFQSVKRA